MYMTYFFHIPSYKKHKKARGGLFHRGRVSALYTPYEIDGALYLLCFLKDMIKNLIYDLVIIFDEDFFS